ncbi:helix-turn-helix domain-containing protein [Pseudomonas typographi]|uniref:Helix-turn-helix transcriptional regulator n=1 Tax=Pseudomonas typographi TaxID=2715964 RepID=A0ABR7Z5V9_9PSED|nr:helix-turn-helix transcriptional regulator [Pseudomonas typographi]MBD1589520.1 helix-turn-helix transcriptional regulator [Pseudomonas typographi]MBD1600901.1 helix-turn-helix transcriptional regulator [Pseudomonas typographi]
MESIGLRLRKERERLAMTQRRFGEIGGVEPNAQGKYESGERFPKADYLEAVAQAGVDVLYVLAGKRTPQPSDQLASDENGLLVDYRALAPADQAVVLRVAQALRASGS